MDETLKKQLEITACKVRLGILEGVFNAKSGHPGGSLSIADLLTYLYFAKMNVYPDKPEEPERDRGYFCCLWYGAFRKAHKRYL